MNANEYQQLAMRTNDGNATYRLSNMADNYLDDPSIDVGGILNGCLGSVRRSRRVQRYGQEVDFP